MKSTLFGSKTLDSSNEPTVAAQNRSDALKNRDNISYLLDFENMPFCWNISSNSILKFLDSIIKFLNNIGPYLPLVK